MAKRKPAASRTNLLPGPDDLNIPPDDLNAYTTCIYGAKGVGKTTLASSYPGYVVIMTEPLRKNLNIRMFALPCYDYDSITNDGKDDAWAIFKDLVQEASENDTVNGLAIDTIDRLYDACLTHHCVVEGVRHPGGLNDFGALWSIIKDDFETTLNSIRENDLGLLLLSHAKETEIELNTGSKAMSYAPSCSGAATRYIKAACDYAFFYGYHGRKRAIHLRGFEKIWTSCGVPDRFISKSGEPLTMIEMGTETVGKGYQLLQKGFNNELWNYDEEPEEDEVEEKPTRKPRRLSK
jgi:hypothetical protein